MTVNAAGACLTLGLMTVALGVVGLPMPGMAQNNVTPVPSSKGAGDPAGSGRALIDLGGGRLQLGPVLVDRQARRLEVPGVILDLEDDEPLEFVVAAKDGYKAYESLVMIEADAVTFNLACLLIGLTERPDQQPELHFDPTPVEGDTVVLRVAWETDDGMVERQAEDLMLLDGAAVGPAVWNYTGSMVLPDGRYLAALGGVIVGIVHDPDSIIHHREGLGLDRYGAVTINPESVPPAGTEVTFSVAFGG